MMKFNKIVAVTGLSAFLLLFAVACSSEQPAQVTSPAPIAPPVQNSDVPPTNFVTAAQSRQFVGQVQTVCGNVASAFYATSSNGKPTFFNFERPNPDQVFTMVIWDSERSNFPANPELIYNSKYLCVRGLIEVFRGVPQIVPRSVNQIVYTR